MGGAGGAIPHTNHTIDLTFADGTCGVFDMRLLLSDAYYAPLSAVPLFLTGRAECGTVVWDGDRDIAPELLYEGCRQSSSST